MMRMRSYSTRLHFVLSAYAACLLCLCASAGTVAAAPRSGDRSATRTLSKMLIPGTQDLQLIIELSEPPVMEKMLENESSAQSGSARSSIHRRPSVDLTSQRALAYRQQIGMAQRSLKDRILKLSGTQIMGNTDILMNAVIARVPAAHYSAIRRVPGIKKVYFSRQHRMLLDSAAVIHNAQSLWTLTGGQNSAGKGIKIGIIDSGIDISNGMFSGNGWTYPTGFPKYDSGNSGYVNKKVIVARDYISLLNYSQQVQTAVDELGHGTFVAGCAAGEKVSAPLATISGMAPGAYLGNYKVFGTPGINESTTTAAIVAAADDAVSDGMDVINLSLGSLDYLPPSESAESVALENAVKAGVVVTIAAGNDGTKLFSIGSPGATDNAITVGSVTNGRDFLAAIHTTDSSLSTIGYLPSSDGPSVTTDIAYTDIVDIASLDGDGLGCSSLPSNSLKGVIGLVKRGTCTFAVKTGNIAAAGAKAAIVYNNASIGLISMSGLSSATIPTVMIFNSDGVALKQYIDTYSDEAQVAIDDSNTLQAVSTTGRVVSSFSSAGPGTDFTIKPDLVAVGESVYSAAITDSSGAVHDSSGYAVSQGTSFSAPMVAGAAAALRQLHPTMDAPAIKSLLMNTASRNLTVNGTNSPSIVQAGSGLLDMESAAAAGAVFSPPSMSFGVHSYSGSLMLSATLTVQNISSAPDRFTFGFEPIVSGPTITFSQSSTTSIASGSSASVDIALQVTSPSSGGFQGFITATSESTAFVYRIPYWAGLYEPDSTAVLQVSQSLMGGGYYGTLADALHDAQPGNIIEIADSDTYSIDTDGLIIATNSQGLPLHGITIRAASNQTPIIDGSSLASSGSVANILVVGLQNVLFQGLTVEGGYTGMELYQASTTLPLSVTIDQCTISDNSGGSSATGVWIDGGGTIDITHSTIENSAGTGIIAGYYVDGTQLTLLETTVKGNRYDGVDAYGSNVDILNSTFSGNYGTPLYLDYCTGTIEGNTFYQSWNNYNYYGDGLQIADGNLIVRNNLFDSNQGAGIALFAGDNTGNGPTVQILHNTMQGNGGGYGDPAIFSSASPSMLVDGNLIKDNYDGIYLVSNSDALFLNNIIVRSIKYGGVEVDGGSTARIVNNTIYDNNYYGVVRTSGSVTVANSIVYGNAGGNLSNVSSGSIQSSLTSSNPMFVNSNSDDFSLASGSPAIDAGSNTVSDLPFLDYYGKLRVASAGSLPGQGTVDIGAVESASAYPLVYPLAVNGITSALNAAYTTGIAVMNPDNAAAQVEFVGYDITGGLLSGNNNPDSRPLASEAQLAILMDQLFDFDYTTSSLGSALVASDSSLAGFFLICDPSFDYFSTGANATSQTGEDIVFLRHEFDSAGEARYVIQNPGINEASITATLYDADGKSVGNAQSATVYPRGQVILNFDSAALASGYIRIQSDRPVTGLGVVQNTNFLSALGASLPDTESRLFFAHYAVGGGYSSKIGIVNSGTSSVNLTLSAYYRDGNLLARKDSVALAAGGQLTETVTDLFGLLDSDSVQTGYIVAQGDRPGIMGYTGFTYNDGTHYSDAAMPADTTPRKRLLFSHIAEGVNAGSGIPYHTGIALLNPFGTEVEYTISVYDGSGKLIAQATDTIAPHQKVAKVLSNDTAGTAFFTQPMVLGSGHIEVTTEYGLLGFEMFYTENLSQLGSVPAQR